MKVLVTGGCGFVGSNLIPHLVRAGYAVKVLDNLSVGSREAVGGFPVELIVGDVREPGDVRRAVDGTDAVVHLAAQTGVLPSQDDPRLDCDVNVVGTLNLLLASRDASVQRFVFASSNAPLGSATPPAEETRAPRPLSPYGASKLAGEGYCSAFFGSFGVPTVALRFANVYGPRSSHKESVVARFIRDALHRGALTIYGDGRQTRDMLHVEDLCRAVLASLASPLAGGELFQLATGVETTVLDLARLVIASLPRAGVEILFESARPGEVTRSFARIDKARRLLGWSPEITLADGVPRTCAWFVERLEGTCPTSA